MESFIVIAILLLAALVLVFRFSKRRAALATTIPHSAQFPEWTGQRGLFDDPEQAAEFAQQEVARLADEARAALLSRAEAGDRER
jgi:hypothetical protein